MSADLTVHVISRADLAARRIPPVWRDPEGFICTDARDLHILLANPFAQDDRGPAEIVALLGNDVVGRLNVIPGEIVVEGQPEPVLWGRGLLVSANHRQKGIASALVAKWESLSAAVGGCGVGSYAGLIYRKRGWAEFALPKYIFWRRSRRLVQYFLKLRWLSSVAAPPASLLLGIVGGLARLRLRRATRGLSAISSDRMSAEFDGALRRQRAPIMVHRSAAWMNWLLADKTENRAEHRLFYARDARQHVVGYFLIRSVQTSFPGRGLHDVQVATLKDWGVFDDQATDEVSVALLGVRELLRLRADLVQLFTADAALGQRLRRLGFLHFGELAFVFHARPPSPAADGYRDFRSWRISAVEGDNYFNA